MFARPLAELDAAAAVVVDPPAAVAKKVKTKPKVTEFVKGECGICVDAFNKTTRKAVTCQHCGHQSCTKCAKVYLLGSVHLHHCMNCRKEWTLEFMNDQFSASFMKHEYRKMRERVFFEEEKTYLPALLPEAERITKMDKLKKYWDYQLVLQRANMENEDQYVREQKAKDAVYQEGIDKISKRWNKLHRQYLIGEPAAKREVIMKCPMNECRGFLDTRHHCGLCETTVCKDCHKGVDDEHKCDPNDVASITELQKSTKPCPKCHVRIFKTDGCDQMFCIQCHTAFSWNTGMTETGIIHNPHYFEALRAGNITDLRHRQDHGGCGPVPDFHTLNTLMRMGKTSGMDRDEVQIFYQNCVHHRQVTLTWLGQRENMDHLRVSYLSGKIDETKFMQKIYVKRQNDLRHMEERQVLDSYLTIVEELFRSMTQDNVLEILAQLRTVCLHTKEAVEHMNRKFPFKGLLDADSIGYKTH